MDFALSWGEREKNGQQTKAIKAGDNPFQLDWLQTTGVKWILKEISHIKRRHLSGGITAPLAAFDGTETKCSLHTVVWLNMHGSECIRRLHACYSGNGEPGALEAFCFFIYFLCAHQIQGLEEVRGKTHAKQMIMRWRRGRLCF